MADLSDITKRTLGYGDSNALGHYIHDFVNNRWLCPCCRGVVLTAETARAVNTPEGVEFMVNRHKCEAQHGQ